MNAQKNTVMAGYGLGAVFGVIRAASAQTVLDFVIAAALTGAEFCAVRLIETKAAKWQADKDKWQEEEAVRARQEGKVKETGDELARRQELLDKTERKIVDLEAQCLHDHLMSDLKTLLSIAMNAVRNGYHAGIASNYALRTGYKGRV